MTAAVRDALRPWSRARYGLYPPSFSRRTAFLLLVRQRLEQQMQGSKAAHWRKLWLTGVISFLPRVDWRVAVRRPAEAAFQAAKERRAAAEAEFQAAKERRDAALAAAMGPNNK